MSRLRTTHLILFRLWDKDYKTLDKKQPIFQGQAKHSVCPARQALDLAAVGTGGEMASELRRRGRQIQRFRDRSCIATSSARSVGESECADRLLVT
jgi:hypothetical protein